LVPLAEFLCGSIDRAAILNSRVDKGSMTSFLLGTAVALRSRNLLANTDGLDPSDETMLEVILWGGRGVVSPCAFNAGIRLPKP
jgi:hypothetical protein